MEKEAKKILVVDDSALMRRVLCDIINSDKRFFVEAKASDGVEAFELLSHNTYDAVVLDVNMPRMNGLELLKKLREERMAVKVMMASTDTKEGAQITLDALELGAMDFIHKPERSFDCRDELFVKHMLDTLHAVACAKMPMARTAPRACGVDEKIVRLVAKHSQSGSGKKLIAIASSTGGPRALQEVIPGLPAGLNAPVLLVQHMPKGFTASLADRLNNFSEIRVKEAADGEILENGTVYVAMGGRHMHVKNTSGGKCIIHYDDAAPHREGVKPCANYMYESLADTPYEEIVCVVLTGMGADGTEGIANLKKKKKIQVIAQNSESCVVYGMPKSVVNAGLADKTLGLDRIAEEIILLAGVTK